MNTTEEWRVVPSLPTHEVSSLGRIRIIPVPFEMPNGGFRVPKGHPRLGVWNKRHKRYDFTYKRKAYRVARLVCEAFNGLAPKGFVCMHKDENSRNNKPENLKWATQKENLNCPKFKEYCSSKFKRVRKIHSDKINRHSHSRRGVVV